MQHFIVLLVYTLQFIVLFIDVYLALLHLRTILSYGLVMVLTDTLQLVYGLEVSLVQVSLLEVQLIDHPALLVPD